MSPSGDSVLTLTLYGAEEVVPHHNVMGVAKVVLELNIKYLANVVGPENICVNKISARPMKILAAIVVGDFRSVLRLNELNSQMRRNVTIDEVGRSGPYFLSDLSSGVAGELQPVDGGYHVVVMNPEDAPDVALGRRVGSSIQPATGRTAAAALLPRSGLPCAGSAIGNLKG